MIRLSSIILLNSNMFIHLSPKYAVRNERNCSYLIQSTRVIDRSSQTFDSFCILSFMGFILAHIGDFETEESLTRISSKLGISRNAVNNFITQLTENPECKNFMIDETHSVNLPPDLLVRSDLKVDVNVWESPEFDIASDYVIKRPEMPLSVNLMVTTQCTTDCAYCYANRSLLPLMDTDTILGLIDELYIGGVTNITLTGGDVFARKDWMIILKKLREYGYFPYLSTKTPIGRESIVTLKGLGYDEIQFSLDSCSEEILKKMVAAPNNYLDKVKNFLLNAEKLEMKVLIRSVLTRHNSNICTVKSLYDFLCGYGSVREWVLTPAFFSPYKQSEYKGLEVYNTDLKDIYDFIHQEGMKFYVGLNKITKEGYCLRRTERVEDFVISNQIRLANTTSLSILANGKCSVCEMLYEDEDFILGDIHVNSVREIWNSPKATDLYSLSRDTINSDSPCYGCKVFTECRQGYGKRICYLDIRKTGKPLSFPDPRCPMAEKCDLIL